MASVSADSPVPPPAPPATEGVSHRSFRGFLWLLLQTLGSKSIGIIGQILLARLLSKSDFGVIGVAYAAAMLPNVLRQTGVPQILVQKQSHFGRWANAAFWFELTLGLIAAYIMLLAERPAVWFFKLPVLPGILSIIALAIVINALTAVPTARLSLELKFREIALVGFGYNVLSTLLSVILAALGFGPFSFVIPLPAIGLIRAVALWLLAPYRIRPDLQFRRWANLAAGSGLLMGSVFFRSAMSMSETTALKLFRPIGVVGDYFFASNLAGQVLQVLSQNFSSVIFPVLSAMRSDPERQTAAFFRATRIMTLVGIPVCALEAAVAYPAVTLFFGDKWQTAVLPLRLLAAGAAFSLLTDPLLNLMQAQGRFVTQFWFSMVNALIYIPIVALAAYLGGIVYMCTAIAGYSLISVIVGLLLAAQGTKNLLLIVQVFAPPVLISCVALLPYVLASLLVSAMELHRVLNLAVGVLSFCPLYALLVWTFCRRDIHDLRDHALNLLSRLNRSAAS
jgi:O-antigen/teichoic acid export membrane protein